MLRIVMSVDGEGAGRYFDRALTAGDYYASKVGAWGGKGAERLGLVGDVSREDFIALASNKVPRTGGQLTVRKKENRRAGYDFTFSVPKSVSVYLALSGDKEVKRMV
jgi:conjugative relaxase-like TrwC/TraI family protein